MAQGSLWIVSRVLAASTLRRCVRCMQAGSMNRFAGTVILHGAAMVRPLTLKHTYVGRPCTWVQRPRAKPDESRQ